MTLSLPFPLLTSVHPMPPYDDVPGLSMVFYNMFMLASVVNPLIYVFTNDFYKNAFFEVFGFSQLLRTTRSGQISQNISRFSLNQIQKRGSGEIPRTLSSSGLHLRQKRGSSQIPRTFSTSGLYVMQKRGSGQISRTVSSSGLHLNQKRRNIYSPPPLWI